MSETPKIGMMFAPVGQEPTEPGEGYVPMTHEEATNIEYMRSVMAGRVENARLVPMRIVHDGKPRVLISAVANAGDEMVMTPLAIMVDEDLMAQIQKAGE